MRLLKLFDIFILASTKGSSIKFSKSLQILRNNCYNIGVVYFIRYVYYLCSDDTLNALYHLFGFIKSGKT